MYGIKERYILKPFLIRINILPDTVYTMVNRIQTAYIIVLLCQPT